MDAPIDKDEYSSTLDVLCRIVDAFADDELWRRMGAIAERIGGDPTEIVEDAMADYLEWDSVRQGVEDFLEWIEANNPADAPAPR